MLVRHNGYSYYNKFEEDQKEYNENEINDPKVFWNPEEFQGYIDKHEYEAAYQYAKNFIVDDPRIQKKFSNSLEVLRSEGRAVSAIYNKFRDNPEAIQAIEFSENVFKDNGLENVNNNEYVRKFKDLKNRLGSSDKDTATSLSLTFLPKKQTLFGQDWLDWAVKDNPFTIDAFYEKAGLSELHLKSAGISPKYNKDGSVTIQFDKTNPLANQIIANAFSQETFREDNPKTYYALKTTDNTNLFTRLGIVNTGFQNAINNYMPVLRGYNDKGEEIYVDGAPVNNMLGGKDRFNRTNPTLNDIQELIFDASNAKEKAFELMGVEKRVYSSTVTDHLDDGWYNLQKDYANKRIDYNTYQKMLANQQKELADFISSIGSASYEIYSNQNNDAINDEVLRLMSAEDKGAALRHISAASGDIMIKGMISNGKMGVLVSVPATPIKDKDIKEDDNANDRTIGRRFQYFIPGLLTDKVQAAISKNTTSRSSLEINRMQDYGYEYTTANNKTIMPDGTGHFIYDGDLENRLTTEEARRIIDKDMMLQDANNSLTFQFVNNKGKGFDKDVYEMQAKALAIKAANEYFPNIPLTTNMGIPLSIEEIFNAKGFGQTMNDELADKVSVDMYDKIMEIYDIYDNLMSNIGYYFR